MQIYLAVILAESDFLSAVRLLFVIAVEVYGVQEWEGEDAAVS